MMRGGLGFPMRGGARRRRSQGATCAVTHLPLGQLRTVAPARVVVTVGAEAFAGRPDPSFLGISNHYRLDCHCAT
jgi:hypothetical protein